MRLNEDYILQEIADEYIVVPIGDASDRLHGVIRLNEAGAFLWKTLLEKKSMTEDEMIKELIAEYSITESHAKIDIKTFISQLLEFGCLERK